MGQKSRMFHRLYDWKYINSILGTWVNNGLYISFAQKYFLLVHCKNIYWICVSVEWCSIVIQFHDLIYCEQYKINLPIFFCFRLLKEGMSILYSKVKRKEKWYYLHIRRSYYLNSLHLNNRISALFLRIFGIFIFL